jgi:hypothetical protein
MPELQGADGGATIAAHGGKHSVVAFLVGGDDSIAANRFVFKGANVADQGTVGVSVLGAGNSALVVGGAGSALVDRRTSLQERMGEGGTSVVLQDTKEGIKRASRGSHLIAVDAVDKLVATQIVTQDIKSEGNQTC